MVSTIMITRRDVKKFLLPLLLVHPFAQAGSCPNPVYLTLDTGNMSMAGQIAETLRDKNVRATFFLANNPTLSGKHALTASWSEYWRTRVEEGHAFGNHTWSHHFVRRDNEDGSLTAYSRGGSPVKMDKAAFCNELLQVEKAFHQLTGHRINKLWRAPGGRTTGNSIRWTADCGYPVHVGWSSAGYIRDDLPSDKYPNQALLDKASSSIRKGDIIIMHMGVWDRKEQAAVILPDLIDNLRARGFCFETLDGPRS